MYFCYKNILLLLCTFVNMLYLHLFLYGLLVKLHRIHMLQAKIPSNHLLTIERYRYFLIQFCPFPSSSVLQFQSYPFFSSILPRCIFQLRSLQDTALCSPPPDVPDTKPPALPCKYGYAVPRLLSVPARLPLQSVLTRYKNRWSDHPQSSGSCDTAPYPTFQS